MRAAVVGSINMDMTVTAERIPLKGETLKGGEIRYIPGGKGANQAVAMAKLGADVEMFGCVGDDGAGKSLINNLRQSGVGVSYIKIAPEISTGIAVITVGDNDNTIVVVAGANDGVNLEYVDSIKDSLIQCDIVLLQHEIPQQTVEYVIDICYEAGVKVVLNPGPARMVKPEFLEKVDYLTPNEHEANILYGKETSVEDMLRAHPGKLVITRGSKGVSTCLLSGEILNIPARKAKVVDTTGAGDTLSGAFTVQIAEGRTMEEALCFANTAASLSTQRFGAQGGMPDYTQVIEAMEKAES